MSKRPENQKAAAVREINPSLLVKISQQPIGAGTLGQVYLAEYRGMKTVKEMKMHNESRKETERCKRKVVHEAEVINSLGGHPNLPFLFGVCTKKEPILYVLYAAAWLPVTIQCSAHYMLFCCFPLSLACIINGNPVLKIFTTVIKQDFGFQPTLHRIV